MAQAYPTTRPVSAPPIAAGLCFLLQSVSYVVVMSVKGPAGSGSVLKLTEDVDEKVL